MNKLIEAYERNSIETAKQLFRQCDPSTIDLMAVFCQSVQDNQEDWVRLLLNVGVNPDNEFITSIASNHENPLIIGLLASSGACVRKNMDNSDELSELLEEYGFQGAVCALFLMNRPK